MKDYLFKLFIFILVFSGLWGLSRSLGIVQADNLGSDVASYQGDYGSGFGEFQITKLGGDGGTYLNPYYHNQVESAKARGQRVHTYLWFENILDTQTAENYLNYYMPKVETPKGSIVTLDIEAGLQNNDVISYTLQRIRDWGYTAVYYSYKPFTVSTGIDVQRFVREAGYPMLWIAAYGYNDGNMQWQYFPTMDNIAIWQYSSLLGDRNIDLTGITYNGYNNVEPTPTPQPEPTPQPKQKTAIEVFQEAKNGFTAYGQITIDEIKFVNGMWQFVNYEMSGVTNSNEIDWTLNGIPLVLVSSVSGEYYVKPGDKVTFDYGWNYGTIDAYDYKTNAVGIKYGIYGMIWFNADYFLNKI